MNHQSVIATIVCLILCSGCGGGPIVGHEANIEQSASYEMLMATGAQVALDLEGNIVGVDFEDEGQGDDAIDLLLDIPTLKRLGLSNSAVTDEGVSKLGSLTSLETIDLEDTRVSRKAVSELQEALPDCRITHGSSDDD